jgi:hypothetical protein
MSARHDLPLSQRPRLRNDQPAAGAAVAERPRRPVGIVLSVAERDVRHSRRADLCLATTEITLKTRRH